MKPLRPLLAAACLAAATLAATASPAHADPRHGGPPGHAYGTKKGDYKEEFWDGPCKVERKWDKHGRYKEERECQPAYRVTPVIVAPQPGVHVTPPAVIIQPPAVVITP